MNSRNIYVASSFKNEKQQFVVKALEDAGHKVYDFRNPNACQYHWSDIDPNYRNWKAHQFIKALNHPLTQAGFNSDFDALFACEVCILVLPCNRSSHLELGFAVGKNKRTAILLEDKNEPEAMYKLVDLLATDIKEILTWLQ